MLWSHVVLPRGDGEDRGNLGPRRARLARRGANGRKEGLGPDIYLMAYSVFYTQFSYFLTDYSCFLLMICCRFIIYLCLPSHFLD